MAIIVFASGVVAVMELFHRAQAGSTDGENVLIATQLAHGCQAALRNVAYGSLAAQADTVCTIPSEAAFSRFSRTVTVTPQTAPAPYDTANLTRLDVRIFWNAPGGTTDVTLSAIRSAN